MKSNDIDREVHLKRQELHRPGHWYRLLLEEALQHFPNARGEQRE
jgi:hypothetical protein